MGRSLSFIRLENEKIQGNLSQLIGSNPFIKDSLIRAVEHSNLAESFKIDFNVLLSKISTNPELFNPEEASLLYYWIINGFYFNYELGATLEGDTQLRNYGFDEFYYFGGRANAENTLQELWNFFDPFDQRVYISPDYIYILRKSVSTLFHIYVR
ncbi:hypothetical protein [Emticicia fontis]